MRDTDTLAGMSIQVSDPAVLDDPDVLALLQKASDSLDANPLQKYNAPGSKRHVKQMAFHLHPVKTRVYLGGTRAGKSTAGVSDDLIQLSDRDVIPAHLIDFKLWEPPFKCRIVTPDYGRTFKAVIETFTLWTPPNQLRGGSWENAFKDKDHELWFANGSFVEFMTLEQEVNKFGGSARHRVHYDEEPKGEKGEEIRWQCAMRLADFHGDELFTFSPIHGLTWTFDEFEENKGEEIEKDVWLNEEEGLLVVKASIHDNPHIDAQGREEALSKIPEMARAAYESGDYTHFKGLVYPNFDPVIHVIDPLHPDEIKALTQYDTIDPGQQTTAVLFGGFDEKDNGLIIYDELKLSGYAAIPENAQERIFEKRESLGLEEYPAYSYIDPAARSRDLASGERVDMAWRRAGAKLMYANNEVETGVFEVSRRLEYRDPETKEPHPLLRITSNCVHLLGEIPKYRLNPKEDGTFDVVKKNDHFCDAKRYMCMARPLAPRHRRRRMRQKAKGWKPGTAPAYRPPKRRSVGPMGKFS